MYKNYIGVNEETVYSFLGRKLISSQNCKFIVAIIIWFLSVTFLTSSYIDDIDQFYKK